MEVLAKDMGLKQGMKHRAPSKASKASLVARGLASKSKPTAVAKRPLKDHKGHQKETRDSKPGFSLYTSDSEDQASVVDRGLNRCAALLSNILENEDKVQSKGISDAKPTKSNIKRVQSSHATVRPGKRDAQRTNTTGGRVVIPTARLDDKASPLPSRPQDGPAAIAYNDRLMSSTPVLTAEERQRRQQLQIREAQLQQEILQLKERYELLQRQQSPSHHEEQKILLQTSMMQELESHQQREDKQRPRTSPKRSTDEKSVTSSTGRERIPMSSQERSSARRSLDYSGFHVEPKAKGGDNSNESLSGPTTAELFQERRKSDAAKEAVYDSVAREVESLEPKKRVRIVSPATATSVRLEKGRTPPSPRENLSDAHGRSSLSDGGQSRHGQVTPPTLRPSVTHRYVKTKDEILPSSADNHCRMIQYLVDELRALIGGTDDLEVDRLLTEIDDAVKLLPFLVEKDKKASSSQEIEQVLQPYKNENDQLRRRLLIAHQKLTEGSFKKHEDKSSAKTDLAFELAACRSVNGVLQKQLTEEKNSKEEILRQRDRLSQNLGELQEEKKKFLQILSNKGEDFLRLKREWQHDNSKLTVENKKLQAELEALHLSTEAEKKEINILSISLKQKDAEIDRLKELTGGLQQSLTRLLSDIQQFQPKELVKTGLLDAKSVVINGLNAHGAKTIGQTTALKLPLDDPALTTRHGRNSVTPKRTSTIGGVLTYGQTEEAFTNQKPNDHRAGLQRKHLRFSEEPSSQPKPTFALTSKLSPQVDQRRDAQPYGTVEFFEESSNADTLSSPGLLDVRDLEEELANGEVSPLSSGEDEDFRRGLENLDANIARIQKSLRETAFKT